MNDDLDLMQLVARGEKLARVDGIDYLAVELVFQWPPDGAPAIYCVRADWPTTIAARLHARDLKQAELEEAFALQAAEALKQAQRAIAAENEVRALQAQLAERPIPPAVAAAATGMPLPEPKSKNGGGEDKRTPCPHCGRRIWPSLLEAHLAEKHPPAPTEPVQLQPDDPIWRCADCGSDTFSRSLRDPHLCQRCAKNQPIASTNGQLAA